MSKSFIVNSKTHRVSYERISSDSWHGKVVVPLATRPHLTGQTSRDLAGRAKIAQMSQYNELDLLAKSTSLTCPTRHSTSPSRDL